MNLELIGKGLNKNKLAGKKGSDLFCAKFRNKATLLLREILLSK